MFEGFYFVIWVWFLSPTKRSILLSYPWKHHHHQQPNIPLENKSEWGKVTDISYPYPPCSFKVLKVFSHSSDHSNFFSFFINIVKGRAMREKSLTNLLYQAKPKTSVTFLGTIQSRTTSILASSTEIPTLNTKCPKAECQRNATVCRKRYN